MCLFCQAYLGKMEVNDLSRTIHRSAIIRVDFQRGFLCGRWIPLDCIRRCTKTQRKELVRIREVGFQRVQRKARLHHHLVGRLEHVLVPIFLG